MLKSLSIPTLCLSLLVLSGCEQAHINQGNVFSHNTRDQLKIGMSKEDVKKVLGMPVLINAFNDDEWHYVYNHIAKNHKLVKQTLVLQFKDNKVARQYFER